MSFNNKDNQKGQILMEVLVAVAIATVVLFLGAQFIGVSLTGEKSSRERVTASHLIQEEFEAVKSIAEDNWHNIDISDGDFNTTEYYMAESEGEWILSTGTEMVNLGDDSYERYLIFHKVYRDSDTGDIESIDSGDETSYEDPSARGITVYVVYDNTTVTGNYYLTRWENKVEVRSDWTGYDGNFEVVDGKLQLKLQ